MMTQEKEEKFLTLYDNSSEITKMMPSTLVEPAIIISRILGFENVDAYAIELIRQNIESYKLGGNEIEEKFQEYLSKFVDTAAEDSEEEKETDQGQKQEQEQK